MKTKRGKKIQLVSYLRPDQAKKLKALSHKTKVPAAEYIRQGLDLLFKRELPSS